MELLSDNGLIHAEDLYYMLGGPAKIKLLDATFSLPGMSQSPEQAFLGRRIEGAQLFDIDIVADQDSPLPHTAPGPSYFASCVESLGISNDDHVVIYDQSGAYMASSRAWWLFRLFGHEKVYVLEGGIQAWCAGGYRLESGPAPAPEPGAFTPVFRPELIVTKQDLLVNLDTKDILVVDARPDGRFHGDLPEPRPGMRPGHIPGSCNLPFITVLEQELVSSRGTSERVTSFKDNNALQELFAAIGVTPETKIAATCGSGVTACTIALALYKLRRQEAAVYDGSWTEWGDAQSNTPIEISA